jgi:hypothetical protein
MPPCAAADELHGLSRETAEPECWHFIDNRFRLKERELSAAAESGTTGWRRTATRSMRRGNKGSLRAHWLFVPTEHQGYNARVQRASAEVQAHNRRSQYWHDRDARAFYPTRSRCNEMLEGGDVPPDISTSSWQCGQHMTSGSPGGLGGLVQVGESCSSKGRVQLGHLILRRSAIARTTPSTDSSATASDNHAGPPQTRTPADPNVRPLRAPKNSAHARLLAS